MPTAVAVTSADMALPPQDERSLPAVVLQDLHHRPHDQALAEIQASLHQYGYHVFVSSQAAPGGLVSCVRWAGERGKTQARALLPVITADASPPEQSDSSTDALVRHYRTERGRSN